MRPQGMSLELYSRQNLFRYVSEWNPKAHAHTKGGYLDGKITVPEYKGEMLMRLETLPGNNVPQIGEVSPLILHVVRMGKGKRQQDKEPVPTHVHWRQEFIIQNGKVTILNRTSELDVKDDGSSRNIPARDLVTSLNPEERTVRLGGASGDLNLVILLPKQDARAKPGEATVKKVLSDRLPEKNQKEITELAKFFTGKQHAQNMKSVRLKVSFFAVKPGDSRPGSLLGEAVSADRIIDIGSKDIGALQLHDVTPLKSCARGGRKVVIISEYDLSAETAPVFQLFDRNGERCAEEENLLVQPQERDRNKKKSFTVRKNTIIFLTPDQPNLRQIEDLGLEIWLRVKRIGDGQISNNKFRFQYKHHHPYNCLFCHGRPDIDDETDTIQEQLERPKPRQKKRHMDEINAMPKRRRSTFSSDSESSSPPSVSSSGYRSWPSERAEPEMSPDRRSEPSSEYGHYYPSEQGSLITLTELELQQNALPTECRMTGWEQQQQQQQEGGCWSAESLPIFSSEEEDLFPSEEVLEQLAQNLYPSVTDSFEEALYQGVIEVDAKRPRPSKQSTAKTTSTTPPASPPRPSLADRIAAEIPFLSWIFILTVLILRAVLPAVIDHWAAAAVFGNAVDHIVGGGEANFAAEANMPLFIITSSLVVTVIVTTGKILVKA